MTVIILLGGSGALLHPITINVSKHLVPIYDKPIMYYALSTLIIAVITDISIINTPHDAYQFQKLLGDGSQFCISISWVQQPSPDGLAQAFLLGEDFLDGSPACLILSDNNFYGANLPDKLKQSAALTKGGEVFAYYVDSPEEYGVVEFYENMRVLSLEEKPSKPKTNWAVTGLYLYDNTVKEKTKTFTPRARGELEITDLDRLYLEENSLSVQKLRTGYAWLDTGRPNDLHEASAFIRTLQHRTGQLIGSPDHIAWENEVKSGKSKYYQILKNLSD